MGEKEPKRVKAILDPRIVFTMVVVASFLFWLAWRPEPIGTIKYISIHSLFIAMCMGLSFVFGAGAVRRLKRRRLAINYSGVKFAFNIFTILSLTSTWYFILRPIWVYDPVTFLQSIVMSFKSHNISIIQRYYLTPELGLGFVTLRWLLAPSFALLQVLQIAKRISRRRYVALTLMYLITALVYSIAISSIVRFEEMLIVLLVIRLWQAHLKLSRVLVICALLYLTLCTGAFFKFANVYGYRKISPQIVVLGIEHLTNYYGTSLNYGFYLIDNWGQHLTFPRLTLSFIFTGLNIGESKALYYSLGSAPVFAPGYTTVSGFGNVAAEYGGAGIAIMFLLGWIIGYVYYNVDHNIICKSLYPFLVTGLLEFPRYFYFSMTPLIVAVLTFSITAILSSPNWCRRVTQ